ncbi:MFS transporter [Actinomycetaceae bacterium L2_0104]
MQTTNRPTVTSSQQLSPRRRWASLAVLTASLLVITMDMTILNIAIPEMSASLRPSSDQLLWIVDIYSLVLAGLLVPFAAIADRWGRKRMLLLGYTIFGGASLLVFFAESAAAVIGLRALLGIGGAMIMPTTLSLIRVIFTDVRERATALAIWAAVSGLGAAVGPLVGGFLLEHFSWHSAFLVNVPLMVLALVGGSFLLPESRVATTARLDLFAALLSLAGMTAFVWSIKQFGKESSFLVPQALVVFAVALVLLTWFVLWSLRSDEPLLDLTLFRSRPFTAGILAAMGTTFAMGAGMLLLGQWLQLVNNNSPIEAGIKMLPVALAGAIASLCAPPLARRISSRAVLAGGVGIAGIGLIIIGLQPGTLSVPVVLAALTLVGFGTGSLALGSAMIMFGTPESKAGNAAALEESAYEIGSVLGIAILGSVAALLFRAEFEAGHLLTQLDTSTAAAAEESIGSAIAIANELGMPALAQEASVSFTHSLQTTGLIGGVIMLAVSAIVFFVTPKGTDVSGSQH